MKNIPLTLCICLLLAATAQAQPEKARLDIHLNKNILQPGDSLLVTVIYNEGSENARNLPLATLELLIENEQGLRTRLRWPVISGKASGALYLPDSLPRGRYTVLAGLQRRFFEVVGTIQDGENSGRLQAMLLTKSGNWDEQEVAVAPDGNFTVRNWLFEDNAVMAFSPIKANNQPLDIRISTQLDSTDKPIAVAGRAFYIGAPPSAIRPTLNKPIEAPEALFADAETLLPAVVVKAATKSPTQQFNEEYSTGLFRSGDERLLGIMDDPSAVAFPNILFYLQGRVAGLQIASAGLNGGLATWRGAPVLFFVDEVRVSSQQLASTPMADIAIVKAYPPPFFGAPGGGAGGAVAIYTRRGGEAPYFPADKHVFRVRGYTPSSTVLNLNKLNL